MTFGRTMQTTMMRKGRRQIWSVFHPSGDNFKKNSFQNQTVKIGGGIDLAKYGKKRKDTEEDEQVILDYDDFYKGKPSNSKTDEFSEKFQMTFDQPPPPIIFRISYCKFFPKFMNEVS